MPGEAARSAVCRRVGAGGGPRPVPRRAPDPGPPGHALGTRREVGEATAGRTRRWRPWSRRSCSAALGGLEWARARERRHHEELGEALDRSSAARRRPAPATDLVFRHQTVNQLKRAGSLIERGERAPPCRSSRPSRPIRMRPTRAGSPGTTSTDSIARQGVRPLPPLSELVVALAYSRGRPHDRPGGCCAGNTIIVDRESGQIAAAAGPAAPQRRIRARSSRPTAAAWPRCRTAATPGTGSRSEVKLWDVERGEELAGAARGLRHRSANSCSARTARPWSRSRSTDGEPEFPVRSWKLSDDRRRVTLVESLRRGSTPRRFWPRAPAGRPGHPGRFGRPTSSP